MFTGKKLSGISIAQNIKKSQPISHSTRITQQILQKEKNICSPSEPITKQTSHQKQMTRIEKQQKHKEAQLDKPSQNKISIVDKQQSRKELRSKGKQKISKQKQANKHKKVRDKSINKNITNQASECFHQQNNINMLNKDNSKLGNCGSHDMQVEYLNKIVNKLELEFYEEQNCEADENKDELDGVHEFVKYDQSESEQEERIVPTRFQQLQQIQQTQVTPIKFGARTEMHQQQLGLNMDIFSLQVEEIMAKQYFII